jgi:hypothetical protein
MNRMRDRMMNPTSQTKKMRVRPIPPPMAVPA